MKDYRKIQVWQKAHDLTLRVYKETDKFPASEKYSLVTQMRRACYSIPMNVAEGCGKSTDADFARFLDTAAGSASELDYQLLLCRDLDLLDGGTYAQLSSELGDLRRMLTNLIKAVRNQDKKRPTSNCEPPIANRQ